MCAFACHLRASQEFTRVNGRCHRLSFMISPTTGDATTRAVYRVRCSAMASWTVSTSPTNAIAVNSPRIALNYIFLHRPITVDFVKHSAASGLTKSIQQSPHTVGLGERQRAQNANGA